MNASSALSVTGKPPDGRRRIRDLLNARTRELALHAGRIPPQVSQLDYEQAKRELTGESDCERQNAVLDA